METAGHDSKCRQDFFNPLSSMGTQMAAILVLGHFFHLLLKPIGQPGPIAQILAGIILGPSALANVNFINDYFFQYSSADYYAVISMFFRTIFMFLFGLEMDVPYLVRSFRLSRTIAIGGVITCSIFGVAASVAMLYLLNVHDGEFNFILFVMLILASTASPVVIRLSAELKFSTSDVGRLAISSALVTELTCLFIYAISIAFSSSQVFGKGITCLVLVVVVVFANKFLASWLNTRNRTQKYLSNAEVLVVMGVIVGTAVLTEMMSYNSIIACFFLGVMFPREGKTTRTLLHKLTRAIHDYVLPLYFGYIGFQFDIWALNNLRNITIAALMVVLSIGGKISGTLVACQYLKIPMNEGVVIAFFLNLKGHSDILFLTAVEKKITMEDETLRALLLISVVINTLIAGPMVAYLLRRGEKLLAHTTTALEVEDADKELRMLACVYGPRHVSATLGFISALTGAQKTPITPYLMHLVELPEKLPKTKLSYHEIEEGEFSDEDTYGGNEVVEINNGVDSFVKDTDILIRQMKVVSPLASLYEDVCNGAEDLRTSILLLPFHKHQRIDGTMVHSKEGIRTVNQKVIRHCPCSVGIIVDRGLIRVPHLLVCETPQPVVTLFFGGADDREALAWSQRIAVHSKIYLTLIRFLEKPDEQNEDSSSEISKEHDVLMDVSSNEAESKIDNMLVSEFFNRYASKGKAGYMEKTVRNGAETVAALKDLGDMYALLIVGKGGRGHSHITTGLSDWEECPELGTVGDLLASSDVNISSSVLVIQQHRNAQLRLHNLNN